MIKIVCLLYVIFLLCVIKFKIFKKIVITNDVSKRFVAPLRKNQKIKNENFAKKSKNFFVC